MGRGGQGLLRIESGGGRRAERPGDGGVRVKPAVGTRGRDGAIDAAHHFVSRDHGDDQVFAAGMLAFTDGQRRGNRNAAGV